MNKVGTSFIERLCNRRGAIVLAAVGLSATLASPGGLAQPPAELGQDTTLLAVPTDSQRLTESLTPVQSTARELSAAFRAAAARISPSVVVVLGERKDANETLAQLELLDESNSSSFSAGSGVILSKDGWIVTNNHVVADVDEIRVRLFDGREYVGKELKTDPASDLAVLKIDTDEPLVAAAIGESSEMEVGDWVIAVGSPFLLEQTVSAGIISGKGRSIRDLVSGQLLQTDASINPGNSGGALANLDGELIGINTAIASGTGTFQGVGFAIPTSRVQWIVSELRERGSVRRATLGVTTVDIPARIASELDLPFRGGGAYVARVRSDSPAAKADIRVGDVLLQLSEQAVRNPQNLVSLVEQSPVDEPVTVQLIRDGRRVEVSVTLEAKE